MFLKIKNYKTIYKDKEKIIKTMFPFGEEIHIKEVNLPLFWFQLDKKPSELFKRLEILEKMLEKGKAYLYNIDITYQNYLYYVLILELFFNLEWKKQYLEDYMKMAGDVPMISEQGQKTLQELNNIWNDKLDDFLIVPLYVAYYPFKPDRKFYTPFWGDYNLEILIESLFKLKENYKILIKKDDLLYPYDSAWTRMEKSLIYSSYLELIELNLEKILSLIGETKLWIFIDETRRKIHISDPHHYYDYDIESETGELPPVIIKIFKDYSFIRAFYGLWALPNIISDDKEDLRIEEHYRRIFFKNFEDFIHKTPKAIENIDEEIKEMIKLRPAFRKFEEDLKKEWRWV